MERRPEDVHDLGHQYPTYSMPQGAPSYGTLLEDEDGMSTQRLAMHKGHEQRERNKKFAIGFVSLCLTAYLLVYGVRWETKRMEQSSAVASSSNVSKLPSSTVSTISTIVNSTGSVDSSELVNGSLSTFASSSPPKPQQPHPWQGQSWKDNEMIRGVNLGGWLVLEPWITPSLFEQFKPEDNVVDEYTFTKHLGKQEARRQLEHHWDKWVTEDDIKTLAQSGLTHLRIPVPYWMMEITADEPFVDGSMPYLKRAMEWARKHKMRVVFDLHSAPGSQNGFDNSGRKGEIHWGDAAPDGTYPFIERTVRILHQYAAIFGGPDYNGVLAGIELMNEPFVTLPLNLVQDFYVKGYNAIRSVAPGLAVFISDSFRMGDMWNVMEYPHYEGVYLDTHIYQVFDAYRLQMTPEQHIKQTCEVNKPQIQASNKLYTITGEWALATTDCCKWLNGMWAGSRWEGTFPGSGRIGSCAGRNDVHNTTVFTPEYKKFLKEFAEKQMDAYEAGRGWFFWNFKAESSPQWDYLEGLRQGWMPADVTKRTHSC